MTSVCTMQSFLPDITWCQKCRFHATVKKKKKRQGKEGRLENLAEILDTAKRKAEKLANLQS